MAGQTEEKCKLKTFWEIQAAVKTRYHRLKTFLWYKPFFCSIGAKTVIRNPILITYPKGISIGSSVHIRDGARMELIQRPGERPPEVTIGNNVTIEQNFHLACCSNISIGDHVSIAARCAVVDITHPYWKVDIEANIATAMVAGAHRVLIGRRAFLGLGVTVFPNVEIGEGAVIGAHSVVMTDLPAYSVAAGIPAKVIKYWR